jgi:ribonuclease-3 family protein
LAGVDDLLEELRQRWGAGADPGQMPASVLAYLGDAVYELFIRIRLCASGPALADELHKKAVTQVRAETQARALEMLMPVLTPDEVLVARRGRNAHTHRARKGAGAAYSMATGFEALLGYLFLCRRYERLQEIVAASIERESSGGE